VKPSALECHRGFVGEHRRARECNGVVPRLGLRAYAVPPDGEDRRTATIVDLGVAASEYGDGVSRIVARRQYKVFFLPYSEDTRQAEQRGKVLVKGNAETL